MPNAVAMLDQLGNYRDDMLEGLTRRVTAIHSRGAKVMAQLVHTGSKANRELFPEEGEVWGSSAIADPQTGTTPKKMTQRDITQNFTQKAGMKNDKSSKPLRQRP